MADETETITQEVQTTEPVEAQQSAEAPEVRKPHPLEPGGERWNEIYRERSEYKRRAEELEERLRQAQQPVQQPPQTQFYSQDQLQQMVDAGRITPAAMAGQLALQAKELAKAEIRQEFKQESKQTTAQSEVREYLSKIPKLNDPSSEDFRKAQSAAWEIADEMGLQVTDPRVMRRALRETFGTLDRVAKVETNREFSRVNADTHTETGGGGGRSTGPKNDPLKQVGKDWLDYNSRYENDPAKLRELAQRELDRRASRRR